MWRVVWFGVLVGCGGTEDDCDDCVPRATATGTAAGTGTGTGGGSSTTDGDGDGFSEADGDCDDGNAALNPLATDMVGDGVDQNCDGVDGVDADGDGHASRDSGGRDCDDTDPDVWPGAAEVWYDGIDNGCRGAGWPGDGDQDGDGYDAIAVGGDDCDDLDATVVPIGLIDSWPANGATDAYAGGEVVFQLDRVDLGATVELTVLGGATLLPGTLTIDTDMVRFQPAAPLDPLTAYTATVVTACGSHAVGFTTSVLGAPLGFAPVGSTYALDMATLQYQDAPLLSLALSGRSLLIGVASEGVGTLELGVAWTEDGTLDQAQCIESTTQQAAFTDPYVSFGPYELPFDSQGIWVTLHQARFSGAFTPGGTTIEGVTLTAQQDVRDIMDLIGLDAPGMCALVAAFGVTCVTCIDGMPYCVDGAWTGGVATLTGEPVPSLVTAGDIAADPQCAGYP